jgi:SAM-dependent methyltransferase
MTSTTTTSVQAALERGAVPGVERVATVTLPATADADAIAAIQRLIERLEANYTPTGPKDDLNWYGWIGLPIAVFLEGMLAARRILGVGRHRFLDVGSGIGTKLILAHELGWATTGIERWRPYVEVSRHLVPFAKVHVGDGARYMSYGAHDLVYLYGIAVDPGDHEAINRHIARQLKPGALFFCARRPFPEGLEHVAELVWRRP